MKKLKKLWQENTILFILGIVLIACVIAITVVVLIYFVGDADSKFGDRRDGIEEHLYTDEAKESFIAKFKEAVGEDKIVDMNIQVSETMTVYISIEFVNSVSLTDARSKCLASLENFEENILNFYDIEFFIKAQSDEETEGYEDSGSHNVNGTGGIVWNNRTVFNTEE